MGKIIRQIKKLLQIEYFLPSILLLMGLVVRLYKIDSPVADWHSFRQVDTASVVSMFLSGEGNIFVPKYHDVSRVQSGLFNPEGYRFVEFPIYNYVVFVASKYLPIFNYEIWGRLVSIFCTLLSSAAIYLIGKKQYSRSIGLYAMGVFLLLPYNIFFTRVILPEPMAVTFGSYSILLFTNFLDTKQASKLYLSGILMALAILVKPYMIFYATPLLIMTLQKFGIKKALLDGRLYVFMLICLLPFTLWRTWISNFPEGIPFWKWTFNGDGIRFRPAFWYWIFGERLTKLILGYFGIILFTFGIFIENAKKRFSAYFILGMFLYVSVIATANVKHDYYQTLTIPAISFVVALGINNLWNLKLSSLYLRRSGVVLSIIFSLLLGLFQVKEFYKINHPEIIEAGREVDQTVPKDSLVIASYNGDTAFLYQTKRRGWPVVELPIDELIEKGASYFVSVNLNDKQTQEFEARFETVKKTNNFVILKLK